MLMMVLTRGVCLVAGIENECYLGGCIALAHLVTRVRGWAQTANYFLHLCLQARTLKTGAA